MHKHFLKGVVAAVVFSAAFILRTSALEPASWIDSLLHVQKQADTTSLPTTASGYGNIDCAQEDANNCSVPTNYGEASSNSSVRFISSGSFVPITTYIDSQRHFSPVPNSDVALSYYSGPVYGLNLAFNYNLAGSAAKKNGAYAIVKPPDGKLMDKARHLLAADPSSVSFSENGRWMVVSIPNTAIARVNLQTFEVLPFATGFNYAIGLSPAAKTAITNDGRYAVVSSNNFSTFKIYDLNTCLGVPDTITGPAVCQSRDLKSFMQSAVPGFNFVSQARFMDDNNLAIYAAYKAGTASKTARFIISNSEIRHQLELLALGDSYISGEGAFDYIGGTDSNLNRCHVSLLAYPQLIGKDLDYDSYHSVACSGAVTNDINDTSGNYAGQVDRVKMSDRTSLEVDSIVNSFQAGYIAQLEFVKTYQPQTIVVSIGGNDMGFADIIKICAEPSITNNTCYNTYEDRLELVRQLNNVVYPRLLQTYQQIKAAGPPDMRVYVIGYPQIAKPGGDCALNVHLNADEVLFSQELINYLDIVVQTAAAKTGMYYVDTQDALYGHRLCEAGPGSVAINGLTAGNDKPKRLGGPIANESYHPNPTGYQLLENKILAATHNLTNPMPAANLSAGLPPETGLELLDVSKSGRDINNSIFVPSMASDIVYQQTPTGISFNGSQVALPAGAVLNAELHSTPIDLGSFTIDDGGNLLVQITIPATVPTGYHSLHFYGTNIAGEPTDVYKVVYVAKSADDLDGNGILDANQQCVGIDPAGQDSDKDEIDDSCDSNITDPPAEDLPGSDNPTDIETSNNIRAVQPALPLLNIAAMPAAGVGNIDEYFSVNSRQQNLPAVFDSNKRGPADSYAENEVTARAAYSRTLLISGTLMIVIGILSLVRWGRR